MDMPKFDTTKAAAFEGRIVDMLNLGSLALMISLGHRTGLFDVMSDLPPSTSREIARASGLNERYVREWLGALTTARIVEYQLPGISQTQVNPKIDLSFASGLRSFLRHDPDVIMVGEIRDLETAEIAIQAALTGHLVLSTIHTNDAPGAVGRLIDMGVKPFLVASATQCIAAQRLARRLCNDCKRPVEEALRPERLLEIDDSETSLARAGHADDHSVRREVQGVVLGRRIGDPLAFCIDRSAEIEAHGPAA